MYVNQPDFPRETTKGVGADRTGWDRPVPRALEWSTTWSAPSFVQKAPDSGQRQGGGLMCAGKVKRWIWFVVALWVNELTCFRLKIGLRGIQPREDNTELSKKLDSGPFRSILSI